MYKSIKKTTAIIASLAICISLSTVAFAAYPRSKSVETDLYGTLTGTLTLSYSTTTIDIPSNIANLLQTRTYLREDGTVLPQSSEASFSQTANRPLKISNEFYDTQYSEWVTHAVCDPYARYYVSTFITING